jgi:hypothetical protein
MWRSVFLHEFLDHRIGNYQALGGKATPASFTLAPVPDAAAGGHAVAIVPGSGFEHVLTQPLQQVIGISCRVRLTYPINPNPHMFSVLRLGAGAELLFWPVSEPLPDGRGTLALARVWVNDGFKNLGQVELPANGFTDFRFDWHTSGQARLLANGRLVGYHNAVAPGAAFAVDRVVFGMPNDQPASPQPLYRLSRVFVRALSRADSLAAFARLLPQVAVPPQDLNRCRKRVLGNLLRVVARLRQFMSLIHQTLSQPWSAQTGPAAGPFRPEATQAHALATESVAALVTMLKTSDFSAPDRFLDPFTRFLRILYTTRPAEFEALAAELAPLATVPDDCKDALGQLSDDNSDAFAPILALLTTATERMRDIAGGH